MCSRRSEISALVLKKTGLDGNRTLIHSGFLDWCNDGSIFAQDISEAKVPAQALKSNLRKNAGVAGVQELQNGSALNS